MRARELFTRGEGEECWRPPAAPKAGGCGFPPPALSPPWAVGTAGSGWARGWRAPGAARALRPGCARVCALSAGQAGQGEGRLEVLLRLLACCAAWALHPVPAEERLVRAAGRGAVDGEG